MFCLIRSAVPFFLTISFIFVLFSPARADPLTSAPVVPWEEENAEDSATNNAIGTEEISPRRLSLKDLEDFTEEKFNFSPLEDIYSGRIVDELHQYGYDLFSNTDEPPENKIPVGTVQDDYVLSTGDKLEVILRGQVSRRSIYDVNSQGFIVIEDFAPLFAAGKTLGNIRSALEDAAAQMHNTQVFVSLSGVRQISVSVIGHVIAPGRKNLTAFHSALDALSAAKGIKKTGSLRRIKLVRKGRSYPIDLYNLLMSNSSGADKLLQDGDRIIVPPIGPTAAISGAVKRAGIYELVKGEKLNRTQMLGLAGGVLTPGNNRYVKLEVTKEGEETVQDIETSVDRLFGDGSILMVAQAEKKRTRDVTLSGHTRQPGAHDIKKAKSLSDLIKDEKILGNDIYPLIGVIERRDANQLTKTLLEFSPRQVLQKTFDRRLNEGDIVHLFSMMQIQNIENAKETDRQPLLHEASLQHEAPQKKDDTFIKDPLINSYLRERSAFVRGSVRRPGAYPVAGNTTLDSVLAVAGGTTLEANTSNIEVTSRLTGKDHQAQGRSGIRRITVNFHDDNPADVLIGPGDTVRVNQKYQRVEDQSVTILGEVNHPGRYDLMAGDTMLSLLERAGGITLQGYPDGAIFSRASERKREQNRYRAQAQDLELKLASSLQNLDKDKKPDMAQISAVQGLVTQLKGAKAVGRITVEADPGSLKADHEQDILLEAGDRIYIPKRPLNVRVAGEVLSPAALQFRKGKSPGDYIREAGGTTYYADKERAFVVYPDGSAQPLQVSAWSHQANFIPPGSTIVVLRDPEPFNFLEGAERISQIFANLAISGLYIDAIGDD